jgi:hypothetical protein
MAKRIRTTSPTTNGKAWPPKPRTRKAMSSSEAGGTGVPDFISRRQAYAQKYGEISPTMPVPECIRELHGRGATLEDIERWLLRATANCDPLEELLHQAAAIKDEAVVELNRVLDTVKFILATEADKLDEWRLHDLKTMRKAIRALRKASGCLAGSLSASTTQFLEGCHRDQTEGA